jgi:hypothetical protein
MAGKPMIAHVYKPYSTVDDSENGEEKGMDLFLIDRFGCDIRIYRGIRKIKEDLAYLHARVNEGILVCLYLEQERYEDDKTYKELIAQVRCTVSKTLPILFFRQFSMISFDDPNVHVFDFWSEDVCALIDRSMSSWSSPDWLGAETKEEEGLLARRLEHAHYVQSLKADVYDISTPDENHRVVAEALRLHLLPVERLQDEFDETIVIERFSEESFSSEVYLAEVDRIRGMDADDRKVFLFQVMENIGYERIDDIWYFRSGSLGAHVNGFAIDSVTMEWVITKKHGSHRGASQSLADRIKVFEMYRGLDRYPAQARFVSGLIFRVMDFCVPIICLFSGNVTEEDFRKVVRKIMSDRRFIPVTINGTIVPC